MGFIESAVALDRWLIELAFVAPAEVPFVSCYTEAGNAGALRGRLEADDDQRTFAARRMVQRFLESEDAPGPHSTAMFARAGQRPSFLALPLPVGAEAGIFVADRPSLYPLACLRQRYAGFLVAVCGRRRMRLVGLDFGRVVLDLLTPEGEDPQDLLLEHFLATNRYEHFVLYGEPEEVGRVRERLKPELEDRLAGSVWGRETDTVRAVATIADTNVLAGRERRARAAFRKALANGCRAATNPCDILRAVEAGRARQLILPASGAIREDEDSERQQWVDGVREVLVGEAIRSRVPYSFARGPLGPETGEFQCAVHHQAGGPEGERPAEDAVHLTLTGRVA